MKKRANALYERVLERWPWKSVEPSKPQWKIDGGQWSVERSATMMLRNVPAALLDRNEKRMPKIYPSFHLLWSSTREVR